jgi:uncharacterized radical SAM superfamily Fe-S cluster-containing enzyme
MTVWCCDCGKEHKAETYEKDNVLYGKVPCPKKDKTTILSNDAALWKTICKKSNFSGDLVTGIPGGSNIQKPNYTADNKSLCLYRLDITDACNFNCPICYANAGIKDEGRKNFFIDIDTVKKIACNLQKRGAKEITFTGGEPTLHPELEKIISVFKKKGFRTGILTNGIRIAKEDGYAKKLKKSGLRRAYIQFDTLNEKVHEKMRGNSFVQEKKTALARGKNAKIKPSVIAVMIKDNLGETGELLEYMKTVVPMFGEIVFVTAIRETGRFNVPQDSFVYKEDIIKSLVKTANVKNIGIDNFYPYPVYRPFGMNIHPGHNVILPLVFYNGKIELFENYIDMKKFYRLLYGVKNRNTSFFTVLKALFIFLSSLNYKKTFSLLWILFCYLTKLGRTYINYVLIESFLTKDFQDFDCLNNCNAYHAGKDGQLCSACIYNQDFKSGHSWTRYTTDTSS